MKQKSILWSIFSLMLIVMAAAGISACDDDDDNDHKISKGIVGTWTATQGRYTYTFIFNSDNTGTYIYKYEDIYSGTETDSESFTYSMTGTDSGVIVLKRYDSYYGKDVTSVATFTIDGNTMVMHDDDDNTIILTKNSSSGGSTGTPSIKGTYTGVDGNDQLTLTFNSNGTGTWVSYYYDPYSGTETEKGNFTYTMSGSDKGTMTLRVYDSYSGNITETWYFTLSGNTLYLYEDGWGEDLEWVLTRK